MFNLLSVFRKSNVSEYIDAANAIVAKSGLNVKVSIVDTMPKEVSGKEAAFNPTTKELIINSIIFSTKYKALAATQYGSIEVYLDVLVSHELGHAYDPNAQSLMLMVNSSFVYSPEIRKQALLQLEDNAWKYGRRFTSYPEKYETFNHINYQSYKDSFFI